MKTKEDLLIEKLAHSMAKTIKNTITEYVKEQEKINEYDSFLETIPEQIQEVFCLLKSTRCKHDLGHSMYVEFDMCWDSEFNQVGLYNVQLHLVKSLEVLLQTEVYEFVDDVVLRAYLEKIRYCAYTVLENIMRSKIQTGIENEERFPEFDWEKMVLNKAEDAVADGTL